MANRYAVASGNWSATSVWSDSDGGAPGSSAPVDGDNVYLTATSGAITVTLTALGACTTLTCTGYTGTLAFGIYLLTVAGNVTLDSGMTVTGTTGGIKVSAAATVAGGGLASFPAVLELSGTGAKTVTASGTTWGTFKTTSGAQTVTLGAALAATIFDMSLNFETTTFAGAYDITAGTFYWGYPAAISLVIPAGQTVTVSTAMQLIAPPNRVNTLASGTASSTFALVYNGAAADCEVANMTFTDVAYSGATVTGLDNWYGGTLTRTSGITNRTSADIGGGTGAGVYRTQLIGV